MEKKCRFCPRVCHKQEHLDRHERTHTKVRPYRCEACEKHFVRRYFVPARNNMIYLSDTLKRHQKLHVGDGQKGSKHVSKTKRRSVERMSETNQSDNSTESSVDQSPVQEVTEPQFSYNTLEAWEFPSFDPIFSTDLFSYEMGEGMGNYFDGNLSPVEESSNGSTGDDYTINPEAIWNI